MKGSMVIIRPADDADHLPELIELNATPTLEQLQKAVGGYIEKVPMFQTIAYAGTVMNCVAFCNEDGKLKHLPINQGATMAWERALRRQGHSLHNRVGDMPADYLVGNIAVLFGDREFMRDL